MLCSLSASLMRMTRTSFTMAKSILRMVSACWSERDPAAQDGDLRHPLHEGLHLPAELLAQRARGSGLGVLQHVVQERGDDALRVHVDVHEDGGDAQRVDEERVARGALLLAVQAVAPSRRRRGSSPAPPRSSARELLREVREELRRPRVAVTRREPRRRSTQPSRPSPSRASVRRSPGRGPRGPSPRRCCGSPPGP